MVYHVGIKPWQGTVVAFNDVNNEEKYFSVNKSNGSFLKLIITVFYIQVTTKNTQTQCLKILKKKLKLKDLISISQEEADITIDIQSLGGFNAINQFLLNFSIPLRVPLKGFANISGAPASS